MTSSAPFAASYMILRTEHESLSVSRMTETCPLMQLRRRLAFDHSP